MTDVVICGLGVTGQKVAEKLESHHISYSVIDKKQVDEYKEKQIIGDVTSEDVLKKAGVEEAKTVVAVTDNDVTNAFITLLAKQLNKKITVLSLVDSVENMSKLDKAGADYIFSKANVGRFIAKSAISPFIADFLDMVNLKEGVEIMQIQVNKDAKIANMKNAKIWKKTGAHILAIKRGDDTVYSPSENEAIQINDQLIVLGNAEQIKNLYNLSNPDTIIESQKEDT